MSTALRLKFEKSISVYRAFFHIAELETTRTLQYAGLALLFSYFLLFSQWSGVADFTVNAVAEGRHLCWPFFQTCGEWYFLTAPPLGNLQALLYAVLFGLTILAAVAFVQRRWALFHALVLIFFCWQIFVMGMAMRLSLTYWYFVAIYTVPFLFLQQKLLFLRITVVVGYVLSATVKFDGGWIAGTYFSALEGGLIFIPDELIVLATNTVVVMQAVGVWFLLSTNPVYQRLALSFFVFFHLYSFLYVGFVYPSVVLPMLIALFGVVPQEPARVPFRPSSLGGFAFIALLFTLQSLPWWIQGDVKMTFGGYRYGFFMFDANHQCRAVATIVRGQEETVLERDTISARNRCDPYAHFFYFKQLCGQDLSITAIRWVLDHSINGGPFYRIVDIENACILEYHPFSHNEWIRLPERGEAPAVGVPRKNVYF